MFGFFDAANQGNLELMSDLIKNGVNITPTLIWTIQIGEVNVLKRLIENGFVDVNVSFHTEPRSNSKVRFGVYIPELNIDTPLTWAIKNHQIKIVELLIKSGAYLYHAFELNPLRTACMQGNTEIVKLLIDTFLLKNSKEEIPNYIQQSEIFSIYWDQQTKKINYLTEIMSKDLSKTIFNKFTSGKSDSLLVLSFYRLFNSLDSEIISNKFSGEINTPCR
jgi:hypothetical protein